MDYSLPEGGLHLYQNSSMFWDYFVVSNGRDRSTQRATDNSEYDKRSALRPRILMARLVLFIFIVLQSSVITIITSSVVLNANKLSNKRLKLAI